MQDQPFSSIIDRQRERIAYLETKGGSRNEGRLMEAEAQLTRLFQAEEEYTAILLANKQLEGLNAERVVAIVAEIEERIVIIEELSQALFTTPPFVTNAQVETYRACLRLLNGTNSDEETRTDIAVLSPSP